MPGSDEHMTSNSKLERVGQLIDELKKCNSEAQVRIGMWYGSGSPEAQLYEIEHLIKSATSRDAHEKGVRNLVLLTGNDPKRSAR